MPITLITALAPTLTRRRIAQLAHLAAIWLGAAAMAHAGFLDDIGHTKLKVMLGPDMLTGAGVVGSQVEAPQATGKYFPDPNSQNFDESGDPLGELPTIVNGTTLYPNPTTSTHATNVVGGPFYGNLGVAPGVNKIVVYEVNDWDNSQLNGAGSTAPDAPTYTDPNDGLQTFVVQNHSWAGTFGNDIVLLRKVDWLVDEYETTIVAGIPNGDNSPMTPDIPPHPALVPMMGNSYNAVVVGRSDGLNSIEATNLSNYGTGRAKPMIVAPLNSASGATAIVSGAAALLHEQLAETNGVRSEPLRAILMAGSTKAKFTNYVDPATGAVDSWARIPSQPLDNIFGAGEVNVLNNYIIAEAGEFDGSTGAPTPANQWGWDYGTVNTSSSQKYEIVVPEGSFTADFSIALTWNVDINPTYTSQTLANLTLRLKDSMGAVIDESTSGGLGASCNNNCDNTEHIYIGPGQLVTQLGPGTYTLEVSTALSRDYGLAWRMTTLFGTDPNNLDPSADFDDDGDVDGIDFLTWQRGFGTLLNADHADGDANGDRMIDEADLLVFNQQYGLEPPPLWTSIDAVPEPGALALAGSLGAICLLLLRYR